MCCKYDSSIAAHLLENIFTVTGTRLTLDIIEFLEVNNSSARVSASHERGGISIALSQFA